MKTAQLLFNIEKLINFSVNVSSSSSVPIGSDNPFGQLSSQEITSLSEVQLEVQEESMSQPANADYNPNAQSEEIHNSRYVK